MSSGNLVTVAVIALGTAEKEQRQQKQLESAKNKPAEIYLCGGQSNGALKILQERRMSGSEVLFYTDWEVAYKYSQDPYAFIRSAGQLVSPYNVFVV